MAPPTLNKIPVEKRIELVVRSVYEGSDTAPGGTEVVRDSVRDVRIGEPPGGWTALVDIDSPDGLLTIEAVYSGGTDYRDMVVMSDGLTQQTDSADELMAVLLGWRTDKGKGGGSKGRKRTKKPNCTKGRSCGLSCIPRSRQCKADLSPAAKAVADSIATSASSAGTGGNARRGTAGGGAAQDPPPEPRQRRATQQPQGGGRVSSDIVSRADTATSVNRALSDRFGEAAVNKAQSNAQRLLDKANIYVRVPNEQIIESIISDGRFKTSGELGFGRLAQEGVTLPSGRNPFARALDGSDDITEEAYSILDYQARRDSQESFMFGDAIADRGYSQRPVYGYMADSSNMADFSHAGANGYGAVAVRLKPEVKERATVTGQDSFAGGLPVPVNRYSVAGAIPGAAINETRVADSADSGQILDGVAKARSIAELNMATRGSYTETQIQGQVKASDIAGLVFTRNTKPTAAILEWAEANGVEITVIEE